LKLKKLAVHISVKPNSSPLV